MLDLALLPGDYAICRLPAGLPLPAGFAEPTASTGEVISVTWTPDEVSILCPAGRAPAGAAVETPWRCLRVVGPLDFALVGVLASLVGPLADARVSVVTFSTYDTDYVLVPTVQLGNAREALTRAGHRVAE